jgi:hypothetical protein
LAVVLFVSLNPGWSLHTLTILLFFNLVSRLYVDLLGCARKE